MTDTTGQNGHEADRDEADRGGQEAALAVLRPRLAWFAALAVVGAALFVAYLGEARAYPVNSDGAGNALQASDMLHGNVLLHGWWLSDVSFYTTELPEYALVEWVHRLRPDDVHICAALTYTLLVLLTALVGRGTARGREGLVRALLAGGLMVAPTLGFTTNTLLESPDHTGTAVPIMAALLLLDRSRRRWYPPLVILVVLAWVQVADPLALVAGAAPVAAVGLYRAARRVFPPWRKDPDSVWFDIALAVAAGASVPAAQYGLSAIRRHGGFYVNPVPGHLFASASVLTHQLRNVGQCVLILFGADPIAQSPGLPVAFAFLHMAGVAIAVAGLLVGLWFCFWRLDRVGQMLVAGTFAVLLAGWLGTHMDSGFSAHEIAPVLPFMAALAGRTLGGPLARLRARYQPVLAIVLAGYLCALGYASTRPPVPASNQDLAGLLVSQNLRQGLAGYWQADSVTLDSGGQVTLAPIYGGSPYLWEVDSAWFDPGTRYANFVVTVSGPAAETTFAKPA